MMLPGRRLSWWRRKSRFGVADGSITVLSMRMYIVRLYLFALTFALLLVLTRCHSVMHAQVALVGIWREMRRAMI